jgi:ribosomal protein S18 acetylase RimI-like enzyme
VTVEALEFRQISPGWESSLAELFEALERNGDAHFFHPHPLTAAEARNRCTYAGRDLYYIAVIGGKAIGYGMLRGWDEGYEVPSLGIAIHPERRASKLGLAMMLFLHSAARMRGAKRIRLRVYKDNNVAKTLYETLGYTFTAEGDSELIGYCEL